MSANQPINAVKWVSRDSIKPNDYNPNRVASPELKLLKISIMEDGWTQPIVINPDNEIVDGFHRWTVSGDPEIFSLTGGMVPVVVTSPKNDEHQKMSTIRHNRARGTHGVLDMAAIIQSMVDAGISQQEIEHRLQMEPEEVVRLALRVGIPKSDLIQSDDFSKAWSV
jgi:ParB-like chromosome segregation protein Spo0J